MGQGREQNVDGRCQRHLRTPCTDLSLQFAFDFFSWRWEGVRREKAIKLRYVWTEKELTIHYETHSSSSILKNKDEGLERMIPIVCWLDFSGDNVLPFGAQEHYFLVGRPFQDAIQNVFSDGWEKTFP